MVPGAGRPGNRRAAPIIALTTRRPPPGRRPMDKKTMLQVLLPAAAAAGVVLLVGVLIALGDGTGKPAAGGKGDGATTAAQADTSGTTLTLPPVDAPEWTPGRGGMKVWDVAEGSGEPCKPGATVTIHYTGWTLDGGIFDSSVKRNEPATFPLASLIKGWQEGIPGMKPGGVRRLLIPSDWAYGKKGSPPNIPPDADLVFEVKLIAAK